MDQLYLEKERELFKLNAKLNARNNKRCVGNKNIMQQSKSIQMATNNCDFSYCDVGSSVSSVSLTATSTTVAANDEDSGLELMCKKMSIANQPSRRPHDITYPLIQRTLALNKNRKSNLNIHMPITQASDHVDLTKSTDNLDNLDHDTQDSSTIASELISWQNESLITRYSDDSSVVPPANIPKQIPVKSPIPICANVLPKALERRNISSDGLLKFLKSKVAILQSELDASKSANDKLQEENVRHVKKIKKLTTQCDKSNGKIELLEISLKQQQTKVASDEQELKENCKMISELNREILTLRNEFKEMKHNYQVIEKRMIKTQEDHDSMKSKYESFCDIELIMRESAKQERLGYEEKLRRMRKGRIDLLKAYKQQLILIDNLRRQNVCLENTRALELSEREFLKVLDWNFSTVSSSDTR